MCPRIWSMYISNQQEPGICENTSLSRNWKLWPCREDCLVRGQMVLEIHYYTARAHNYNLSMLNKDRENKIREEEWVQEMLMELIWKGLRKERIIPRGNFQQAESMLTPPLSKIHTLVIPFILHNLQTNYNISKLYFCIPNVLWDRS